MFKNGNDQDFLSKLHEQQKENHLQTLKALGEIGSTLKNYMEKLAEVKTELLSIAPGASKPFRSDGFRFNSLYVSDAQVTDTTKLLVSVDGLTYTKTLSAGENLVNIPDNSSITISNTSGNATGFILSRYNYNKN